MDIYSWVKLGHILAATGWVGGAFLATVLTELALKSPGPVFEAHSVLASRLGALVFMPSAVLTLVFGIILTIMSWSFGELWIILALAGIASSMVMGVVFIKPTTDRIGLLFTKDGPDSPQVRGMTADLLRIGRLELVLMVIVIADMVLKPRPGDILILGIFAAVLVLGAGVVLVKRQRPTPVTA